MITSLVFSRREAIALLVADIAGLFFLFGLAHFLRIGQGMPTDLLSLVWIAAVFLLTMYVFDLYGGVLREGRAKVILRTASAIGIAALVVASLVYIIKPSQSNALYWRSVLPVGTAMFLVWAIAWRNVVATWAQSRVPRRWLVLGYGPLASHLWRETRGNTGLGRLCFLKQGNEDAELRAVGMPRPEGSTSAVSAIFEESWSGVILATERAPEDSLLSELMQARLRGVRIYDLTDFYERFLFKLPVLSLHDRWLILAHGFDLLHHTVELRAKRLTDIVLSFVLILVLLPLILVAGLAVKLDSKGPVLYSQRRTGRSGVPFTLYKFRTMFEYAEQSGPRWTEMHDPRITRIGRFLRAVRIDELPQLWNVLLGEMSFIGPRPERPDLISELQAAIPYYDLRHLVKPGITGWAQVLYPYGASVEDALEKLQYDLYYIKNYSLMLDLVVLVRTLRVVLLGRGR